MDTGRDNGTTRVTIKEAAARLGVTEGAVRKRVQRDSVRSEMGDDGRVYVYLDAYQDASHPESQGHDGPVIEVLGDQVAYLKEQLAEEREARRRADTIIAQLTQANAALAQRVPELEAPASASAPPEAREEPAQAAANGAGDPRPSKGDVDAQNGPGRPWWRRLFG